MNYKKYYDALNHPLLLLVVGALISSYIIPFYSREWQDHQKELELKSDLVGKIGDAVTNMVIKTQAKKAVVSIPYEEFYDTWQTWESASATIASRIRAYFYSSPLTEQWNNYSKIVTDFAFLSISSDACKRLGYVQEIQKYFSISLSVINRTDLNNCRANPDQFQKIHNTPFALDLSGIDWNELIVNGNDRQLSESWLKLKQGILNQKDNVIQEILRSHISVFA
jgi:hypothetical protein